MCLPLAILSLHFAQKVLYNFLLLAMRYLHQVTIVKQVKRGGGLEQSLYDVNNPLHLNWNAAQVSPLRDGYLPVGELIDRGVRLNVEVDVAYTPHVIQKIVVYLD